MITGVPTLVSAEYSRQQGVAASGLFLGSPACGTVGSSNCVVVDYTFNEGVSVNNTAASRGRSLPTYRMGRS